MIGWYLMQRYAGSVCEWRRGKKERLVRYCELGKKNLNAQSHQLFERCSCFEPEEAVITEREQTLRNVMRDCAVELRYLERLRGYMDRCNQKEAEYQRKFAYHKPLVRADDAETRQRWRF